MCVWQNTKKKQKKKKKKKSRVVINVAYFNQDINSKLTIFS
jgi:6,7-dimethyl-8-ribityllumazine synthase